MGAITYTKPDTLGALAAKLAFERAYKAEREAFDARIAELEKPLIDASVELRRNYLVTASKLRHVRQVQLIEHRSPTDYAEDLITYDVKFIAGPQCDGDVLTGMEDFFNIEVKDYLTPCIVKTLFGKVPNWHYRPFEYENLVGMFQDGEIKRG